MASKNINKIRALDISAVGILLGISIVFLYGSVFVPGLELTFYALAGLCISLIIYKVSIKSGVLLYFASLLITFILLAGYITILPYIFFFGPYGLIRYYIEKINNHFLKWILKIVSFNILISAGLLIFKTAFLSGLELPDYGLPILIAGSQIIFILYDYIIKYVLQVFRSFIK